MSILLLVLFFLITWAAIIEATRLIMKAIGIIKTDHDAIVAIDTLLIVSIVFGITLSLYYVGGYL